MESGDHDLLIRLDEKMGSLQNDFRHFQLQINQKADLKAVNEIKKDLEGMVISVRESITLAIRPLQDQVVNNADEIDKLNGWKTKMIGIGSGVATTISIVLSFLIDRIKEIFFGK